MQDGVSGIVIPLGGLPALKNAIARLIADDPLREQIGSRAGQSAARYATRNMAAEFVQVVKNTVSDDSRRIGAQTRSALLFDALKWASRLALMRRSRSDESACGSLLTLEDVQDIWVVLRKPRVAVVSGRAAMRSSPQLRNV